MLLPTISRVSQLEPLCEANLDNSEFTNLDEVLHGLDDPAVGFFDDDDKPKVMFAQVIYIKPHKLKTNENKGGFAPKTDGNIESAYDRMLVCRCMNSPDGCNMFSISISQRLNCNWYKSFIQIRDTGAFSKRCSRALSRLRLHSPI